MSLDGLTNQERGLVMLRDKLEVFSAHCLKVLPKEGGQSVPFMWNRAQKYIHERLERQLEEIGYVRASILKGRQQGCCYAPEMRVLTTDYRWVSLADIQVGETVFAVDEEASGETASGRKTERRSRSAVIEAKVYLRKEAYEVVMSNGTKLRVTGEHRHLCQQRGGCVPQWRTVSSMKVGDQIRAFSHGPDEQEPFEDGWFGGMLDGEGSFGAYPAPRISMAQVDGPVLRRAKAYLEKRGIHYYELVDRRKSGISSKLGDKPVHCLRIDRQADIIRLMSLTRPTRFMDRGLLFNRKLPKTAKDFDAWPTVVSITPIGEIDVIDLQTSEKTFICEGLVSHNSTYVGARFYHKASMTKGLGAFIMTHEDKATTNLFNIVKRYDGYNPLAPKKKASNAQELIFGLLDSGYKLATSGSKDVGRSNTARLFHGSEVGFWANASSHMAAIGETIPSGAMAAGTEMILESTANGQGNYFHSLWQKAEAGESEYQAIFVPWFWQDEYRTKVRPGFELSSEDVAYQNAYDLDMEQMQWRANKIADKGVGMAWLFDQEYPATPSLAFQSPTQNPLINPTSVMAAVNSKYRDNDAPLIIGCDPAGDGANDADRTAIAFRRGRMCYRLEYHSGLNTMQIAGKLAGYYKEFAPDGIFIDKGGLGAGVYDRLTELNIPCIGVNNAERAHDHERYENRRAECWWLMKEWFDDAPCRIPNDAALISDITAPQPKVSSNGRKLLEKKEDMKKRGIRSPDGADALALTFAEPVAPRSAMLGMRVNTWQTPTSAGY